MQFIENKIDLRIINECIALFCYVVRSWSQKFGRLLDVYTQHVRFTKLGFICEIHLCV